MRSLIPIFLILACALSTYAQQPNTEINLANLNKGLIESLFLKKLNALREEQKVGALATDKILTLAANDQATYMAQVNEVTHSQKTKGKETPFKRIQFYKGTHDQSGENCAKFYLKKPLTNKKNKTLKTINTYEEAAEYLYRQWFESPAHYRNMINKVYDLQGISLVLNKDSSIFATQVFSAKPFIPPADKSIRDFDYGILPRVPFCDCMNSAEGKKALNSLICVTVGDSVFLKSEDLPALKKFFNDPKDAFYLDIVLRRQFTCDNNNLLHGAEMYEGTMLKPIYFLDMYKSNRAKDGKNFYAPVSRIAPYFKNQNYQANRGYVKKGYACFYNYLRPVPDQNLKMLYLFPKYIYTKNLEVIPDTFSGTLKLFVPFLRSSTNIHEMVKDYIVRKMGIYEPYLKKITIKTYSSVEGNTESNTKLQEARAEVISKMLRTVTTRNIDSHIESKENWAAFYKQISNTPFHYLAKLPETEIKERLKKKSLIDSMDYILAINRIAEIEIDIEAIVNNQSSAELILGSYKKASELKDSLKAFRAQNRLLEAAFKKTISRSEILDINLPHNKSFLPMWTNYLALAATDEETVYNYAARDTAMKVVQIDSTYMPLQFNFCILALRYLEIYKDTLIPIPQLEKKMTRALKTAADHNDSTLANHMWLNYSILSLYHHWELHEYDKLDKHLLNVKKYYPGADISTEEAIQLGLLFNAYHRYDWTTRLLIPYLKTSPNNENLLYLFIKTYDSSDGLLKEDVWVQYLKKAKHMNPKRFYEWFDQEDFQGLRRPEIKREFCGN
ncbi:MAG: CAP domain-containing protein [Bacteroidota bacterium]